MIYTKRSESGVNLSNTCSKLELIIVLSIYLKYKIVVVVVVNKYAGGPREALMSPRSFDPL